MGVALSAPIDEKPWYYPAAPVAALLAIVLTWVAISIWWQNASLGACSYRLTYSPYSEAFSIWGLIYLWAFFGHCAQLSPAPIYTAPPLVNLLACLAWTLCAVWVVLFNPQYRVAFVLSAVCISSAAASAVAAATLDWQTFEAPDLQQFFFSVVPNSLLGGWLLAASSLGGGSRPSRFATSRRPARNSATRSAAAATAAELQKPTPSAASVRFPCSSPSPSASRASGRCAIPSSLSRSRGPSL